MEPKLSTHVLDTASGRPAGNMRLELHFDGPPSETASGEQIPGVGEMIVSTRTNGDGRTDAPLLSGSGVRTGAYRLVFFVGEYFRSIGNPDGGRFLNRVSIDFIIDDKGASYHVPLLVSPWAYSTYRGS